MLRRSGPNYEAHAAYGQARPWGPSGNGQGAAVNAGRSVPGQPKSQSFGAGVRSLGMMVTEV